jgi:hypothetical protein
MPSWKAPSFRATSSGSNGNNDRESGAQCFLPFGTCSGGPARSGGVTVEEVSVETIVITSVQEHSLSGWLRVDAYSIAWPPLALRCVFFA